MKPNYLNLSHSIRLIYLVSIEGYLDPTLFLYIKPFHLILGDSLIIGGKNNFEPFP